MHSPSSCILAFLKFGPISFFLFALKNNGNTGKFARGKQICLKHFVDHHSVQLDSVVRKDYRLSYLWTFKRNIVFL